MEQREKKKKKKEPLYLLYWEEADIPVSSIPKPPEWRLALSHHCIRTTSMQNWALGNIRP